MINILIYWFRHIKGDKSQTREYPQQAMYQKQVSTPSHYTKTPPIVRSRTASLGYVVPKTSFSPSQVSKRTSGRSHIIAASSTPGLLNRSQKALNKGSRKNWVSSLGFHISSLLSISSQVNPNIKRYLFLITESRVGCSEHWGEGCSKA